MKVKIRNKQTGQIIEVDSSELGNYGLADSSQYGFSNAPGTQTTTPSPVQQQPTEPQPKKQGLLEGILSPFVNTAKNILAAPIEVARAANLNEQENTLNQNTQQQLDIAKKLKTEKDPAIKKLLLAESQRLAGVGEQGRMGIQKVSDVQNPFLSRQDMQNIDNNPQNYVTQQVKDSVNVASWGIPFGKGSNLLTKALIPGAFVGGIQSATQDNATPTSVATGAVTGAAGAGILQKILPSTLNFVNKTVTDKLPESIMNKVFKQSIKPTKAAISKGTSLGQEALARGEVGTTQQIYNGALERINNLEADLQTNLVASKAKVPVSTIRNATADMVQKLKDAGNNDAAKAITDRISSIEKENGANIPVMRANDIKRTIYEEIQKAYGTEAATQTEGLKVIAKSIKDSIAKAGDLPKDTISQINKDLSFYGRIRNSMLDKMTSSQRNNTLGLVEKGGLVAGLATGNLPLVAGIGVEKAANSTIGKTVIANILSKIGNLTDKASVQSPILQNILGQTGARVGANQSTGQLPQDINQPTNNPDLQLNNNPIPTDTTTTGIGANPLEGYTIDGKPISAAEGQLIKSIADYKVDISKIASLRNDQRENLAKLVTQYDPTWDASQYTARVALRKDFTSGSGARNIRSLNTAIGHLASLEKAGKDLGNTSIPLINTIKNAAATGVGQPQTVKFNNAVNAVAGEMATIFKGTSGTDQEIQSWKNTMNAAQSPQQIQEGINQMIELMSSRLSAFQSQWDSGIGKPRDFKFLSDKSRSILENLGVDSNQLDPLRQ